MKRIFRPIYADTEIYAFKIPVKWEERTVMNIEARSLKEAIQYVNRKEFEMPDGEYVDDSFEIDYDRLED